MFKRLKEDIAAVKEKDPAARSSLEIFFYIQALKRCVDTGAHTGFITGAYFS